MKKVALVLVSILLMLLCVSALAEGEIEVVQTGAFAHPTSINSDKLHVFAEVKNVSEQNVAVNKARFVIGEDSYSMQNCIPDVLQPGETGYVYGYTFPKESWGDGKEIKVELTCEKTRMAPLEQHEVMGRIVTMTLNNEELNFIPAVTITNKSDKDVAELVGLAAVYEGDGKLILVAPVENPGNSMVIPVGESGTLQLLTDRNLAEAFVEYVKQSNAPITKVAGVVVIPFE